MGLALATRSHVAGYSSLHRATASGLLQRQQYVHWDTGGAPLTMPNTPASLPGCPLFSVGPFVLLVGCNVKLKQAKDNKFIFFSKVIN